MDCPDVGSGPMIEQMEVFTVDLATSDTAGHWSIGNYFWLNFYQAWDNCNCRCKGAFESNINQSSAAEQKATRISLWADVRAGCWAALSDSMSSKAYMKTF